MTNAWLRTLCLATAASAAFISSADAAQITGQPLAYTYTSPSDRAADGSLEFRSYAARVFVKSRRATGNFSDDERKFVKAELGGLVVSDRRSGNLDVALQPGGMCVVVRFNLRVDDSALAKKRAGDRSVFAFKAPGDKRVARTVRLREGNLIGTTKRQKALIAATGCRVSKRFPAVRP